MTLEIGKKAPAIKLKDQDGSLVSLKDFLGKKVIVYFYPRDMTPGCTIQACDFRDAKAKLSKKKIVVLGISKDSQESHLKFKEKESLNFTLLSDIDGKICEAYGVWKEKNLYGKKSMGIVRSTFVIDENGLLEQVMMNVKAKEHVEKLLASL